MVCDVAIDLSCASFLCPRLRDGDADGQPLLECIAGCPDAAPQLKDGLAAEARFSHPTQLLLLRDAHEEPYVLIADKYALRVLTGPCVGGRGEDRVATVGGQAAMDLAIQHQRMDSQTLEKEKEYSAHVDNMPTELLRCLGRLDFVRVQRVDHRVFVTSEVISYASKLSMRPLRMFLLTPTDDPLQPQMTAIKQAKDGKPMIEYF